MNKKSATIAMLMLSLMSANVQATQVQARDLTISSKTTTNQVVSNTTQNSKNSRIKKLNKVMYATTVVNVRNKPSSKGKKLGTLRFSQKVKVTGQDKNTGWYRITYKGKVGYVSGSYLSTSKPSSGSTSKPSTSKPSTSKPSNGGSSSSKPSTSKPSTSKPSKPSTSKPSNDSMYETDCAGWSTDGQADCYELKDEDDAYW